MRKQKNLAVILIAILCLSVLSGCKARVATETAVYETGTSNSDVLQTDSTNVTNQTETDSAYNGNFSNLDGRVEFAWNIPTQELNTSIPILEAVPHYFTEDDIRSIAHALFGDIEYYDLGPASSRKLSKSEIESRISILEPYLDAEKRKDVVRPYYGEVDIQKMLDEYRNSYANAPDSYSYQPCDWTFKSERYYDDTGISSLNSGNASQLKVMTSTEVSDYYISAIVENSASYKRNCISVQLGDGSNPLVREIQTAEICDTTKPSREQITAIAEKAQNMLNQMETGDFRVIDSTVTHLSFGNSPRYAILVQATQDLAGCPVIIGQAKISSGVDDLNTNSTGINYPMTNIRFIFNTSGELISFSMDGIVDVIRVNKECTASVPFDDLCSAAELHLSELGFSEFDEITGNTAWMLALENDLPEDGLCFNVNIDNVQFGLARRSSENETDRYQYVPATLFGGTISCINQQTGNILKEYSNPLVLTSIVDGKILE